MIGAPYKVSQDLLDHFRVDIVVHGFTNVAPDLDGSDPYELPKQLDKFINVDSGNNLTTPTIVERIIENRLEFIKRNAVKEQKEVKVFEALQKKKSKQQDHQTVYEQTN